MHTEFEELFTEYLSHPEVAKAYEFALVAHTNQRRAEGLPYISHCVEVARIIWQEWGITNDPALICAALLHDTVEDTGCTLDQIKHTFGNEVAMLVDGVSQLRSEKGKASDRETLSKVVHTAYLDPRVLLLKLADRLHNMRTLQFMPPEKQKPKATETLLYAKMAESLGLFHVQRELEDLSFCFIDPENFTAIQNEVEADLRVNSLFQAYWLSKLKHILAKHNLTADVLNQQKGYFALSEKRRALSILGLARPDSFRNISDLTTFKVTLATLGECYQFLGFVHQELDNLVNFDRLHLFIGANALLNGYQAIQTTIELPQGSVQIEIATPQMAAYNEWGIVSKIREGEKDLRQFARKLIFTPQGDVVFLPEEATAIDLAYALSERLGADSLSAVVDGKEVPMTTVIPNGSTVEILFSAVPRFAPDVSFLDYCLDETQAIIQRQLLMNDRESRIMGGSVIAEKLMISLNLPNLEDLEEKTRPLLYDLGCQRLSELFFKLASGILTTEHLVKELERHEITKEKLKLTTIRVTGLDQPGILATLTGAGPVKKGNILSLVLNNLRSHYRLRMVIEGLTFQDEEAIKSMLEGDSHFENWSVV